MYKQISVHTCSYNIMVCLICEVWNSVKFPFGNCKWLSRFSLCFKFKFCHLWVLHAERLTWLDTSVSGFCPTLFGLENIYNIRNIWNFLANIRYWDIVIKQSWYSWRHLRWRITLREREESALACLTGGGTMTPGPRCASVPDNKNILPTRAAAGSCSAAQSRHCSWEICLGTVIHTAVDTCTS